jgi:succinate dehydrogenase/fumarate reductase flavoprotein subunit
MSFKEERRVSCDVLVIGGGGAGLRAAIEARKTGADVLLASKSRVGYANNTYLAKSSIAASGWGDRRDNHDLHANDTMAGGRFLNDRTLVSVMAGEAKAQIAFLEDCGVGFAKADGDFQIGHVAGHRYPRHIRGKKRSGDELVIPLKALAIQRGVKCADRVFVTRLFESEGRVAGAAGISTDGCFHIFIAKSVILATGGYANVYLHNNNAAGISGDGQALAFEVGVPLKDIEFVQFYPTALGRMGNRILLYETFVLDHGATLTNAEGEDIVVKHGLDDPMRLTRDRLARAIIKEILEGRGVDGGVMMDISAIPDKTIGQLRYLLPLGWSSERKTFFVSPTAHFCMGGVGIDNDAQTPLTGLFAAGEVCAGIHGANRLGGNALCEAFAMGCVAGRSAASTARETGPPTAPEDGIARERARLNAFFGQKGEDPAAACRSLKQLMWIKAGIVREKSGLEDALAKIEQIRSAGFKISMNRPGSLIRYLEFENMLLLSEMICRAALLRAESRGSHYRSDFPGEDDAEWRRNILIRKADGKMYIEPVPVPFSEVESED